jgi:hypothetical protein
MEYGPLFALPPGSSRMCVQNMFSIYVYRIVLYIEYFLYVCTEYVLYVCT